MAHLMAIGSMMILYWALGWQGLIGTTIGVGLFHCAYRIEQGHWFGD